MTERVRRRVNQRPRRGHVVVVVALLVGCGAARADAQSGSAPPGELSTLPVPGGQWALAELGVPPSVERASAVRILVQRRYDASPTVRLTDEAIARVQAQLDLAVQVEQAARMVNPQGALSLAMVTTRQSRDRLRAAVEAFGGRLHERRQRYSVELADGRREGQLQAALRQIGLDPTDVAARLNQGETVTVEVATDRLPLAFAPTTWTRLVVERELPARALFAELLRDPDALLMWHGALALDASTRRFLEASPDLLRTIHRQAAPLFSAYSAHVAVRGGRLQVAGDTAVAALWEGLVGEPVSAPADFVRRLYTRDEGRLAVFFDLIQALPDAQREFATGAWLRDPAVRLDRFRALYTAVSRADADWTPATDPLKRYPADPWLLLRGLAAAPGSGGNGLAGPQQRRFWARAFEGGWPEDPERALRDIDADGPVDAAWLVERVCIDSLGDRPGRFQQVLVLPRMFPAPATPDLPRALMAARGLVEFPALLLVLERGGMLTPTLAVQAVRQAALVQRIGDRDRRTVALIQLQGAVALVDRLRMTGVVSAATGTSLLSALMAVPLRNEGFAAGVAAWLVDQVVPVLPPRADGGFDGALVAALAVQMPRSDRLRWEGREYVVDWTGAERDRLARLRAAQGGVSVDEVVRLVRIIRVVEQRVPATARAQTTAILEIEKTVGRLRGIDEVSEPVELTRVLPQARRELDQVRGPGDGDRLARAAVRLSQAADWLSAHVLLSLAYLPHFGDPSGPAARAGDLAFRHHFGAGDGSESARLATSWAVPITADGDGAITGSLLGLDHAMARLSLRRLSTAAPPQPTLLTAANQQVLALQVVASNPREAATAPVDALAAALARGRARLQGAAGEAASLDALAEAAAMSADRRSLLAWMSAEEAARVPEMFTLAELVHLGGSPPLRADALGTPTQPFDTRLGLAWRPAEPWESYSGRPSLGLLAASTPELPLRIADWLVQAALPPSLYPGVLAFAMQDLLDGAALTSSEDWLGFGRQARALTRERFDDFVSALAGLGILAPADRGSRGRLGYLAPAP